MKYNKDYFTGMKHLADAILYELNRLEKYNIERAWQSQTIEDEYYYQAVNEGISTARSVMRKTLQMQLEVKGNDEL